jgi:ribonuclease BN (tRNA processing enzyme)
MAADSAENGFSIVANDANGIIATVLSQYRHVLLYGAPGTGKSVLAAQLGRALAEAGQACWCLSADPGSPAFGVPGAVSLGRWAGDRWQLTAFEGLATLDAGRFRLPLVVAAQKLLQRPLAGVLLVDGPGVVRGVAGKELLTGLVEATAADAVLVLTAGQQSPALYAELAALGAEVFEVPAIAKARRPGKGQRARRRTEQWDDYLAESTERDVDLTAAKLVGLPPPIGVASAWVGRQIVLLYRNTTSAMGEVERLDANQLKVRVPATAPRFDTVLIRDAVRSSEGVIETAAPFAAERLEYLPPVDRPLPAEESGGPRVSGRVGVLDVALINGVFGDALLHLRLRHRGRSLLFDLGEGVRLSARVAHQLTDVFISHAHLDHIGGFLWLLRSRIGDFPPCRLYGPAGLARHIKGFIQGILWDRVGEAGPCFEVAELHADRLQWFRLGVGSDQCERTGSQEVVNRVICEEAGVGIRAVMLDHRHTQVVAYAFEPDQQINIRKDRLMQRGLEPGHWLTELKQQLLAGNEAALIQLPDGSRATATELADELVLVSPGKKLVYATDLADTPDNRQRLVALARHAHTLFCEATFTEADAARAAATGHLTTRACGEIAAAADVARLVPFHFSRRYQHDPQQIYQEIDRVCECLAAPDSMGVFAAPAI